MYTQAQNKATQKYIAKSYDDIKIRVPKGQREKLNNYCLEHGVSLNQFVCNLIQQETNIVMHK